LQPGFGIRPQVDPFWGPGALAIATDRPLRCALVADANARRHCETRGGISAAGGASQGAGPKP
jgi:hypothetical protein